MVQSSFPFDANWPFGTQIQWVENKQKPSLDKEDQIGKGNKVNRKSTIDLSEESQCHFYFSLLKCVHHFFFSGNDNDTEILSISWYPSNPFFSLQTVKWFFKRRIILKINIVFARKWRSFRSLVNLVFHSLWKGQIWHAE